jgi:hypothetical protein
VAKKFKNKPETFVDEKQVDEEVSPMDEGQSDNENTGADDETPDDDESFFEKKYIVGENAIAGTRKGVLASGDPVLPEYFKHGQAVFDELVKSGAIVEDK